MSEESVEPHNWKSWHFLNRLIWYTIAGNQTRGCVQADYSKVVKYACGLCFGSDAGFRLWEFTYPQSMPRAYVQQQKDAPTRMLYCIKPNLDAGVVFF